MKNAIRIFGLSMVVILMCSVIVNAQTKGDKAVGGGLSLGTIGISSNYGINAKYQYNILDRVRLEGAVTYYLKKNDQSMYDFGASGHYLFRTGDRLALYPLAGFGLWAVKIDENGYGYDEDYEYETKKTVKAFFAISFGGGVDYMLKENLSLNAEIKYKIIEYYSRAIISVGVTYRF